MARAGARIVVVRHGQTEWSKSGQHTSTTDLPLLEEGVAQARGLAARLAGHPFALVLSSPRQRALQTAEAAGYGAKIEVTDDLVELAYGSYEGKTSAEIRATRPGWDLFRDGTPDGETVGSAGARCDRIIERALAADGDVAVFAHGHILRILAARWVEEAASFGARFALDTASIGDLGIEHGRRVVWTWNDTSHHPR